MRRRFSRLLPIILLALLVQIIAPVGACWAASIAASDPLHSAAICSAVDDANPTGSGNTGHHNRDGCCSACCINHTDTSGGSPVSAIAAPARYACRVAWLAYESDAIAGRSASHAQARAPPANS